MIYFDNAATTKPKNEVIRAIMPYMTDKWYNPSSLYKNAKEVRSDVENARLTIAKFIGAEQEEIYFTSGATESNNWVIRGFDDLCFDYSEIIVSEIEHKSIIEAVSNPALRSKIFKVSVNHNGSVDLNELERLLRTFSVDNNNVLVSICMANSEIGTIQDIKEISRIVHKYNGILHTDATQALQFVNINVKEMGIDLLSASAQKIGGLKGTGILYIGTNILLAPMIYGSQEKGKRGGTENVIGIIAMAKAIELLDIEKCNRDIRNKKEYFLNELDKQGILFKLNGSKTKRLPNNINITLDYSVQGESLIYLFDTSDMMISSGSACNSMQHKPSYVLNAIGLTDDEISKTIRITLSENITYSEIDKFITELKKSILYMNNLVCKLS